MVVPHCCGIRIVVGRNWIVVRVAVRNRSGRQLHKGRLARRGRFKVVSLEVEVHVAPLAVKLQLRTGSNR